MTICFVQNKIEIQKNIGASPSGKAAGFGPAISEVRILPPQPINSPQGGFFVAVFILYLKKFCERNKTINVFDKEQLKIFSTNINNIACENYFYDCDFNIDNPLKRQEAEHLISSIESKIAIV